MEPVRTQACLSAGHIDWYEVNESDIMVCIILDDASRKVLAGGKFSNINAENSKQVLDQAIDRYGWLHPMRELIWIMAANSVPTESIKMALRMEISKKRLEMHGIKPILGSVAHPQTNGN